MKPKYLPFMIVILIQLFFCVPCGNALAVEPAGIPAALEPWKPWVLHGLDDQFCPGAYNDGSPLFCAWPSRMQLWVAPDGGRFTQSWLTFSPVWVPLPGDAAAMPEQVFLDGREAPVMIRNGVYSIRMEPGEHQVTGAFTWKEMPETISVPASAGLISLSVGGQAIESPVLDSGGRLWLQKRNDKDAAEDRLDVRIQRLIVDDIPMRVETRVRINVSGRSREISLDSVLLSGTVPMDLKSPLPAMLGLDGELKIQARPGRWELATVARFEGSVMKIGPAAAPYGQEVWAFSSSNDLRMVKIEGVPSIDPGQTDLPESWKRFPVYLMDPGAVMTFDQIRRGDPDPAPDRLNLVRTWWLDFKGGGFTIHDRITGTMSRNWSLAMNKPSVPGRVSVDGADQLITRQGPDGKPGVELRRGNLDLTADSRYESGTGDIPAVGWDHDFQSVSGELNLPPGWRLITASGADSVPGTWIERWTLLDLFLVLIIGMAAFKLAGWPLGLLALVTVALTYHESGAPRLVWLNLLAATALVRVLPAGWARRLADMWRLASIITLVVLAIPFMVHQVRVGVYPQLEEGYQYRLARPGVATEAQTGAVMEQDAVTMDMPGQEQAQKNYARRLSPSSPEQKSEDKSLGSYRKKAMLAQDPNAQIQTGPGLPAWRWRTIDIRWNGPVDKDQRLRLWLLSPAANLGLAILRVVLLALLIVGLIDIRRWWKSIGSLPGAGLNNVAILLLLPALCVLQAPAVQADTGNMAVESRGYPPQHMLDELKNRLLEKPDCLPSCAAYPRMNLTIRDDGLTILLQAYAAAETAAPLPGAAGSWLPENVLLDGSPAKGLYRDRDGMLWVLLPEGIHTVVMTGRTPAGGSFQLPMNLLRPGRVTFQADGWDVQGVLPDGRVEAGLQFNRLQTEGRAAEEVWESRFPAFLQIERTIMLGLEWEVQTRVTRLTPAGSPVVLSVPLLEGESVNTGGIRVENGQARVNMDARTTSVQWSSTLARSDRITLKAPEGVPWTETWVLDAGPIWHCELSGIPVVHHQDAQGTWQPTWRPWPGETVAVGVTRPEAIPGRTVTIDSARLEYTPGERFDKAALTMTVRTSQGEQHRIVLPEGAKLQLVSINQKSQPIGQSGQEVVIPLKPGAQTVNLEWHQKSVSRIMMKGPEISIGDQAVNAGVTFHMPRNRWILWAGGPRLGPAVLFWSYLAVVILAALALGRIRWTPLKTRHWLLLSLGLTQIHPLMAMIIVGWLLVLGLRRNLKPESDWFTFDAVQIGLAVWTVVALAGLYMAIEKGLLGIPHMQISGNFSNDFQLNWTSDRIGALMPQPWVISLHRMVYHGLMLLWALWLALSLLKWLKWGWQSLNQGGLWKKPVLVRRTKGRQQPPPLPGAKKQTKTAAPDDGGDDFAIE